MGLVSLNHFLASGGGRHLGHCLVSASGAVTGVPAWCPWWPHWSLAIPAPPGAAHYCRWDHLLGCSSAARPSIPDSRGAEANSLECRPAQESGRQQSWRSHLEKAAWARRGGRGPPIGGGGWARRGAARATVEAGWRRGGGTASLGLAHIIICWFLLPAEDDPSDLSSLSPLTPPFSSSSSEACRKHSSDTLELPATSHSDILTELRNVICVGIKKCGHLECMCRLV